MNDDDKVYVVPTSDKRHLYAVLADGSAVAHVEVTADLESAKSDAVVAVKMLRPKARVVYVADVSHHPILSKVRLGVERELATREECDMRPTREDVEALRAEAYVCPTCALVQICKIHAAVEAAPHAAAVVSACLMHAPNEESHDGPEEEQG